MERVGEENCSGGEVFAAAGGGDVSGVGAGGRGEIFRDGAFGLQLLAVGCGGRSFYTVPENHFNCAVGAYTHNIPLSPERQSETEQTLKMMFDLGYVKPEEVPQIPRLPKTPAAILYSPLGESTGDAGRGFVFVQAGSGDVAERSGGPSGSGERISGAGPADLHGAAGNDAAWIDPEFGMHGESRVHRAGRG